MKALTIWQPWASLIMAGAKPYEFRRWVAPRAVVGQRIVIHAGSRPIRRIEVSDIFERIREGESGLAPDIAVPLLNRAFNDPEIFPLASGLGTAILGEPKRATELFPEADSDRIDHHIWGWPLTDIERWEPIVPARGMQGFWTWGG